MLFLVSSAAIDGRMDGAGVRYLQMGRALLPSARVLVATPGETPIDVPGVPVVRTVRSEAFGLWSTAAALPSSPLLFLTRSRLSDRPRRVWS